MRKVLSFVLVLTLVLSSFSMAFAAIPADVKGTPNAEAVEVLMGLGIVNGYPDGSFKPENIVTRAEMAKLIVVSLGLQDYATGTSKFADMAGATWAQGYVNYANGLGIVKGYPDGTFKPSQTVSYDEASAMIVRALGYTDASLLPAMWPSNYVVKAKALGILDDVKSSALGANRGDIAKMIYNALTSDIGTVDADNEWNANSDDEDTPDNFLVRLGAEFNEAAVIYGTEDSDINLVPYTGKYAETYTMDDEIVAIDVESDLITGEYEATSGSTGAGIVEDEPSDTDYNVTAAVAGKHVPYFWNGVEEPTSNYHAYYSIDTASSATGDSEFAVELSGKRVDDSYAISYWAVTENGLFDDNDADDIADEDAPSLFGVEFILDDDDAIDNNQFVLEGADSLDALKADDVVYVYDGWHEAGIKKILVGTEVVTGKVTEEDDGTYTINGEEYELAADNVANGHNEFADPDTFAVGDTITARLDFFGYIYDVEVDKGTPDTYAIVKAKADNAVDGARLKLYTSEDSTKTYSVDDDSDLMDQYDDATAGDLLGFGLDKDGVIDSLDTDVVTATAATLSSLSVLNVDGTTYPVDKDVVVFTLDDDDDYGVTTIGNVETGVELTGAADLQMILDDDGYVEAMLIDKELAGAGDDDTYAVINKVVSAIDADDEPIQKLTGFVAGAAATKYTSDEDTIDGFDADVIDLWNLTINAEGIVTDATTVAAATVSTATVAAVSEDDNAVKIGNTWYALADNAVVYEAEEDGGYEYSTATKANIKEEYNIYLYETDDDEDGFDVVIFVK